MGAIELEDLTQENAAAARDALRVLAPLYAPPPASAPAPPSTIELRSKAGEVVIRSDGPKPREIVVPHSAFKLFVEILGAMASGQGVAVVPLHAMLTTQEAADMLNVSRPFLVKLIETQKLPCTKVGAHRRVRLADLLAYKERDDQERKRIAEELAADAQDMGDY